MNRYSDTVPSFAKLNVDLESFLESKLAMHYACEYVTAFTEGIAVENAHKSEAIKAVINNLNKFTLIGILEKMDVFTADYQKFFGAKLRVKKINSSVLSKQKQQELISREIKQKVEEMCQPSMKVYQVVRKKIEHR